MKILVGHKSSPHDIYNCHTAPFSFVTELNIQDTGSDQQINPNKIDLFLIGKAMSNDAGSFSMGGYLF